jgi:hypothetical protein
MTAQGEFSTHTRAGSHVVKRLLAQHPSGSRFVTAMTAGGSAGLRSYIDALRTAGVRLPDDLEVVDGTPVAVRHRWVDAPSLLDTGGLAPGAFLDAVARIGDWVRRLDDADARLDANLANFCVAPSGPVLVDVLPPLVPSLRPTPENQFDELFDALCFDSPVILDAFVGYALRKVLRRPWGPALAPDLVEVVQELVSRDEPSGFAATWFATRARLAIGAATGERDAAEVDRFFKLTSVLAFRELDETGRTHRREAVRRAVADLAPV